MNWIEKHAESNIHHEKCDIAIVELKDAHSVGQGRICMKFFNTSFAKFTKNGLLAFAVEGNRIYFREGSHRGFKLTGYSKDNSKCHIYLRKDLIKNCDAHFGDYTLMYDVKEKLWYIDFTRKLEVK